MYYWLAKISQVIMDPVTKLIHSLEEYPLIVAILLGVVGAVAPCQLTGNMSAIALFGNKTMQKQSHQAEVFFFIFGKIIAFSLLGLLAWIFGEVFGDLLIAYFPLIRKAIGPLIIITGLVLLGILKLKWLQKITGKIPMRFKSGKLGSFLLGVSFSLAFCPTMFVIFFLLLMPITISTPYGFIFPAVFGIATTLPLLILYFLIWFFDAKRFIMKSSMKTGQNIQRLAGILLIIIGIFDTITFWEI